MDLDRWLQRIWPPWELRVLRAATVAEGSPETRWTAIVEDVGASLPVYAHGDASADPKDLEAFAARVLEAENKRLDGLEGKAATYLAGASIAATAASAVAKLAADRTSSFSPLIWTANVFYVVAIAYFLSASYYAVETRRVGALAQLSVDAFLDTVRRRRGTTAARTILLIAIPRWNEPELLRKSNCLWVVTEALFIRGLVALAIAAVLGVGLGILPGQAVSIPATPPTLPGVAPTSATQPPLLIPSVTLSPVPAPSKAPN